MNSEKEVDGQSWQVVQPEHWNEHFRADAGSGAGACGGSLSLPRRGFDARPVQYRPTSVRPLHMKTNESVLESALTRVMETHVMITAVHAALRAASRDPSEHGMADKLLSALYRRENEAWQEAFMWGLTMDGERLAKLKQAAYASFLSRRNSVMQYMNGGDGGPWMAEDEEKFRAMSREAFGAPEENEQQG